MSMCLTALPEELISCVVANIESKSTLCNLARCSRQFYRCTIPHLYRHVTIQENIRHEELQEGQLRKITSLLIRRPDLAGLVRNFTLHTVRPSMMRVESPEEFETPEYSGEFEEPEESETSEYSEEFEEPIECGKHVCHEIDMVDQAFKIAVNASCSSQEEEAKWLRKLRCTHIRHHDLILALLLPALPKLEELILDLKSGYSTHYLEQMIHRAARRERPFDLHPPFEALTVFMHSHNFFTTPRTSVIASLLKLPAIQEISGAFFSANDDDSVSDMSLVELDSSSSPLTSLDLFAHSMSQVELNHMLRAPKALKTFSYKVSPPARINLAYMCHALKPQEKYLGSLSLDYQECYGIFYDSTLGSGQPGYLSFMSFNSLKIFKTAAVFLETMDNGIKPHSLINFFPPSLETLHLIRFQVHFERLLEAVEYLLARKSPEQIPSLKKVILDETGICGGGPGKLMDVLWKGTQETAISRLSRVAEAQSLSIHVIESIDED